MKVALDVTPAVAGLTGVARYGVGLWHELERLPDVEIRPFAVGRRADPDAESNGVHVVRLPLRFVHAAWRRVGRPRAESLVGDVDLVHSLDLVPAPRRRPSVITIHDVLPAQFPEWYPPRIRRAYDALLNIAKRADAIIATCDSTAIAISDCTGIDRARIAVANPGWQRLESISAQAPIDGPYILATGAVTPRKGYAVLAAARDDRRRLPTDPRHRRLLVAR